MDTLPVWVGYRPVRIGWCVRDGNFDDLRRALLTTHALWGGRYNPIIPIADRDFARQLVELFRVDALCPVVDATELQEFARSFSYLPWPGFHEDIFISGEGSFWPTFLDIYHPARRLYEERIKGEKDPGVSALLFEWAADDPLADVFLASFGSYLPAAEIHIDYASFVIRHLRGHMKSIARDGRVPPEAYDKLTANALCGYNLEGDRWLGRDNPGLYVGRAQDFSELVYFWNLRAAGIRLVFYDPSYDSRIGDSKNAWIQRLLQRPPDPEGWKDRIAVWFRGDEPGIDIKQLGGKALLCRATPDVWSGSNVRPPLMRFPAKSALASLSVGTTSPSMSFQLPPKPFYDEPEFHNQQVVVTVKPLIQAGDEEHTFWTPFSPELNEFYGREAYFMWNAARVEAEGLGIITEITHDSLSIHALSKRKLIAKIFESCGMSCEPSLPGRVASRVIEQVGGIQGCRVFKIAGVRKLIEKYSVLDSFMRTEATGMIGQRDPQTGRPNFATYEDLYIEPRDTAKLTPEDVLNYLLKQGVFRVGLNLKCTRCELIFWKHVDDVATKTTCEFCGAEFDVTPQLQDRDWAYRRSGVFGREDNQQGSVPVVLTLQQLDTVLQSKPRILSTAFEIKPKSANVLPCETDFVVLAQAYPIDDLKIELALGECKSGGGTITEDDVAKLSRVADAFSNERIRPYLVFAKTGSFTQDEVERCRVGQDQYRRRVILLSDRELEPYFVYRRTEKEFNIRSTAISLEDLAQTTHDVYFVPKPKGKAAAPGIVADQSEETGVMPLPGIAESPPSIPYVQTPMEELKRVYFEHHSESGRSFPPENQCQCAACKEYRARMAAKIQ